MGSECCARRLLAEGLHSTRRTRISFRGNRILSTRSFSERGRFFHPRNPGTPLRPFAPSALPPRPPARPQRPGGSGGVGPPPARGPDTEQAGPAGPEAAAPPAVPPGPQGARRRPPPQARPLPVDACARCSLRGALWALCPLGPNAAQWFPVSMLCRSIYIFVNSTLNLGFSPLGMNALNILPLPP